jgi:hypothetical protein
MTLKRILLAASLCLAGPIASAGAQPVYQPYPYSPPRQTPPSWSYDPYTSGSAPCTEIYKGDLLTCQQRMPPTYGQPSYWPQR